MAANRAYVALNSPLQVDTAAPLTQQVFVQLVYVLRDSSNALVLAANGQYTGIVNLYLNYSTNNVSGAITSAVQAAESDSSLQVYLVP